MMRLGWLLRMILVVFSWERLLPSVEIENERRLVDEWVVFPGVSVRPSFARHDKDTRRPQTASRSSEVVKLAPANSFVPEDDQLSMYTTHIQPYPFAARRQQ